MSRRTVLRVAAAALSVGLAAAAQAEPDLWIDDASGNLGVVDVVTGAVTLVGNMGVVMTDIAFDPTGKLYGISFSSLYSIDRSTAAPTFIGNLGTTLNSLVFSADGTLYAANNRLYSVNVATGAATSIGNGGQAYNSSGDLAFVGGNLYLSSSSPSSDSLIRLDTSSGAGTFVGGIGVRNVFGLATDNNIDLYGVAGTGIYGLSTATGAGTLRVNFAGQGLGAANGTAFFAEAGAPTTPTAPIPEPSTYALMLVGLGAAALAARRRGMSQD